MEASYRVLFACLGNTCRSPMAEAVFRAQAERAGLAAWLHIDSAGTHNHHPGAEPDPRTQRHAAQRGYDLSALRARQVSDADFRDFDLLLAMDWDNLALLQAACPPEAQHKLRLVMSFAADPPSPVVPDPYDGGAPGFDEVIDLLELATPGLLHHARQALRLRGQPADGGFS